MATELSITKMASKSILSPASGYIGAYDYTLSPYRGCTFGCSYCYVPTLMYFRRDARAWGYSLAAKTNAPELLLQQAQKGKLAGARIFMSPNTDPYVPQEREFRVTRRLLEVFCDYPPALLTIQTRSPLVRRDLDLFRHLAPHLVVAMSITTDREDICHLLEPRCAPIQKRVAALAELHAHGIRTQASLAPLLPCDPEALASLVDPVSNWVVVQALKMKGPGARTWTPALQILREQGWDAWLQGGTESEQAMTRLREFFGPRYHQAQEGFSLEWI